MIDERFREPPDEPPSQVTSELLWRVAVRLYRDHSIDRRPARLDQPEPGHPRCARCPNPWPCSGRRLAELALSAAIEARATRWPAD
jgi:hypothetical protein